MEEKKKWPSYESSEEEEDNQIHQLLFEESSDETDKNSKEEYECNHCKAILNMNDLCINVLTIEESLNLKVIKKIENPEEKQKALEDYIWIAKEIDQARMQRNHELKSQLYSVKEILKRIESEGLRKEPTISELRGEINETQKELKELKTRVEVLEHENS